ncbi:hypothetical protein [Psychrobacillus psychrotolerans]|uniref:hypothetical protein n=1 Tax=Psychrobacillus psychrotolerans TaxID=126156 RepID=UPI003B01E804
MNNKRAIFMIIGFIMLINTVIINGANILAGKFPNGFMAVALTIMAFCLAYLVPHFAAKDERAKTIRERSIYISYFLGIGYVIILMLIFNPTSNIELPIYDVLSIYISLYISTVFISMVYQAIKN